MSLRTVVLIVATASAAAAGPTFHRDVEPILQANCQGCHRPGEPGPMALLTFDQVRPWAQAIKEAVLLKRMPPWAADPAFGKFSNEHSLESTQIDTLVAWVDAGAPQGNPSDAPAPVKRIEGWNIGEPDAVIAMPEPFAVPAEGTIEYYYLVLPTNFAEDKWVTAAEVRPGNREVVHHVIAFVRPKGSTWLDEGVPGKVFLPEKDRKRDRDNEKRELLVGFAPGMEEGVWAEGYAKKFPAGADIVFQLHYTANGKATTDVTKVGLVFADEPPAKRVITMAAMNQKFAIPPGAAAHEVKSDWIINEQVELVSLMPHMHLRGKDFRFEAVYPTGESETLLNVPKYDFNWQFFYYLQEPKILPKGTRIDCTAHFDNSPNNPANPAPEEEVKWGDQSWEEMMIGWFEIAIDASEEPETYTKRGKAVGSDD